MKVKKMFTVIALCLISVCSVFAQHRYDEDLLRACKGNSLRDVQKYLAAGADPNAWQPDGSARYTALGYACKNGNINMVRTLVDSGASIDVDAENFESPLMIAVENGSQNIVNYFVNNCNADTNICNIKQKTVLMAAAESGKVDVLKLILRTNFGDIDAIDNKRQNALHYAVASGSFLGAKELINEGINMYQCDNRGYTPFMRAAVAEDTELVKFFLLNTIFDVNKKDDLGYPSLLLCIKAGLSITLIKTILRYGNEPTSVIDSDGHDIYYYLDRWGTKEMRDAVNEAKYY